MYRVHDEGVLMVNGTDGTKVWFTGECCEWINSKIFHHILHSTYRSGGLFQALYDWSTQKRASGKCVCWTLAAGCVCINCACVCVCVCGAFQGYQCLESSSSATAKVNSNVISTLERKLGDSRTACCIINTCRESTLYEITLQTSAMIGLAHSQVTSLDNTNLKEQLSTFLKEGFG